jgi:hypothetical protein
VQIVRTSSSLFDMDKAYADTAARIDPPKHGGKK